jgi:hypothetical protein
VREAVMDWLKGLVVDCFGEGIVKPVGNVEKKSELQLGQRRKIKTYVVSSSDIKIIWMNKVVSCL